MEYFGTLLMILPMWFREALSYVRMPGSALWMEICGDGGPGQSPDGYRALNICGDGGPGQSPDAARGSDVLYLMVARGRVQLPTFALGVRCSMQLSYRATGG